MKLNAIGLAIMAAGCMAVAPAQALCIHNGELYAKTTLAQEFGESAVVMRGVVLSSRDLRPRGDEEDWGTAYQVGVEQTYKGALAGAVTFFSQRNSGGFYLDVGKTYLLFLDPITDGPWEVEVPGGYWVNYNCGQSRPWTEVLEADRRKLGSLSR